MRYQDARSSIRSGDLLAWSHVGWRSWHDIEVQAVRVFTRSEYAHVGIAWVIGGRVLVIEAVVPKVRIYQLSDKNLPAHWYYGEQRCEWTPEIEEHALSIVGEPYSKWEAVRGYFGKQSRDGYWQCAEAASFIRERLVLSEPLYPTPTSIVEHTLALGAKHELLTP